MQSKKKVLIDLTNYGHMFAGFGQIANNYANSFAKVHIEGLQLIYLLPRNFPFTKHREKYFGDNIICVRCTTLMKLLSFFLPKVDIWHRINHQKKLLRLSNNTKSILTIHDLNFLVEKKPWKAKRYLRKMQRKVDESTVVTAISQYTADLIKQHIDLRGKEVRVIHNGIERIDHIEEAKPDFATGRPFFFTIGQIRRKKNFHLLVDVMRSYPDHDLYICGDDHFDYAEDVRRLIEENQATNVFLTGCITQREKVWLYRHCEAFLFPSEGEGFGLPVIEAMQFGKAVFAANRTSLPEICGGHAILWDDLSPDAMAKVMHEQLPGFYSNTDRIKKLKEYACSFSYERHIQAYIDIYCELAQLT